jgi:hypothetical protein
MALFTWARLVQRARARPERPALWSAAAIALARSAWRARR